MDRNELEAVAIGVGCSPVAVDRCLRPAPQDVMALLEHYRNSRSAPRPPTIHRLIADAIQPMLESRKIRSHESKFVGQMVEQLSGERPWITQAQAKWLVGLAKRYPCGMQTG